jgi:penicillin-binding protein 1B
MQTPKYYRLSPRFNISAISDLPPRQRRVVIAVLTTACVLFVSGLVAAGYVWNLVRRLPRAPFQETSRLYAQATPLAAGAAMTAEEMTGLLADEGYREAPADGQPVRRGTWRRSDSSGSSGARHSAERVEVFLRRFPTPKGMAGGAPLVVELAGGRVSRLTVDGKPAENALLEPPVLASFYGSEADERRPVTLDTLPKPVVQAVLAAEDESFYLHPGISPTGIVRALWVNIHGGQQQGGSTITQQLVKNVYLNRQRTLKRKLKEAILAVALEARYSKKQILEAYLNEIYWGRSGPANLIGLGAAAHAYFGKDAEELTLGEAATLAGMIRGPSEYSPLEHPDLCRERRDRVIQRMAQLGWATAKQAQSAQAEPLGIEPQTINAHPFAPYFTKTAEAEAADRFGIEDLVGGGYTLFATLDWHDQKQAEIAVSQGLAALEKGWEKSRRGESPLQAALVSVDPRDGAIRAWVGGRDYNASQFDRVAQAKRQAGSAFKPVIYAAAFREAVVTPATLLQDSPIIVRVGNDRWQPQDNDHTFRGWVTVRSALEQSLNIPTVRVSLQVGLRHVIDLAHDMGIASEMDPVPALALGSFEVSPYELAQVYATLAAGGLRPAFHGLTAVRDRAGKSVLADELPSPRRVLPPQTAWMVTSILQGVVDRGTGAGVRSQGLRDVLAAKTGTTNDRRDNWFAGYAPNRTTVVWVGYDDNGKTRLSGARAALPIWSRFMAAVRPAAGYPVFVQPEGMQTVSIDPLTGQLATPNCPYQVTETLPDSQVPTEPCQRHQPGGAETWANVNLNGMPIDPATGQPAQAANWDAYGQEDTSVDTAEAAPEPPPEPAPYPPARTFPPRPVAPVDSAASTGPSSIMIRPARVPDPPPPAEPEPEATPEENEATPPPPPPWL